MASIASSSAEPDSKAKLHRIAIKTKLRGVMAAASQRRWKMVKSVTLQPRPGSTVGMVELLEQVSGDLDELVVEGSAAQPGWKKWPDHEHETLDLFMISF
jgi:hypothetical protein